MREYLGSFCQTQHSSDPYVHGRDPQMAEPIIRKTAKVAERTQFRRATASSKTEDCPACSECVSCEPAFGAGDTLIAVKYNQAPNPAAVAALKIKRCDQ